ncbi:hypothetical protein [Thermincola ferriacetica]
MKRKLVFIFSLMLALGLVYFNTSKKVHVAEFYPVNYTVESTKKEKHYHYKPWWNCWAGHYDIKRCTYL